MARYDLQPTDITEEIIREVRDIAMGGSPLSEDTLVALGDLILDDGDPDVNIADALDRICTFVNKRNARDALALSAQRGEVEHDKERVRQGLSPLAVRS